MKFNNTWMRKGFKTNFAPKPPPEKLVFEAKFCRDNFSHKSHVHENKYFCRGITFDRT